VKVKNNHEGTNDCTDAGGRQIIAPRQLLLRRLERLLLVLYYRPSMALCIFCIHYIHVT
jgi:hypothetical protein